MKKSISLALIFSLILTIVIISPTAKTPHASAAWYATGGTWNYRKAVTFTANAAKIPSTQTDFPVLISITDAGLAAHAKANGDDILFTSSNATTKLSHEIESYTSATGVLVAWVKVPSLATSGVIYMYYGNATATNQQNATDVWSNGYAGVWHSNDATTSTLTDSTSGAHTGTKIAVNKPIETAGKIGKAQSYNGSNDYVSGTPPPTTQTTNVSLAGWVNVPSASEKGVMFHNGSVASTGNGYSLGVGATQFDAAGNHLIGLADSVAWMNFNITIGTGWHYIAMTRDSTTWRGYVDGVVSTTTFTATPSTPSGGFLIGKDTDMSSRWWHGSIDNTYIASSARSADWIATEYANQNDPGSFYSLDGQVTGDSVTPSNPTSMSGYSTSGKTTPITSSNFYNYPTPYFEWPAAETAGGAHDTTDGLNLAGVAGYYSYFGTSCGGGGADPAASRGVLSDTGGGLHYSATTNVTVPDLTTNNGIYCLRMKTADNAGNVSAVTEQFIYNFDITAPNAPTFVAVNPAGYSSVNSFDFTWPVATDVAGAGSSGIQGYQYKRGGSSGDDWSATQVGTSKTAIASYQTGENIFLVRSIDNAGNISSQVQTTYYYSANPPTKPTALSATPAISDTNSFAFTWTAPVHARPIVDYGYSINAAPFSTGSNSNITWTGSNSTTLSADHFATAQGVNTLYLVAKDDSGAYALSDANVATVTFNCTTVAPPIPTDVSISDSTNRAYSTYTLTTKWSAGTGQDAGTFDHYSIERSTDGLTFAELATTTSTAYIDASGLNNTTTYYYLIRAVDNAGSTSAASTIVSKIPTGKYTVPPTIVVEPTVVVKAASATISWVTNRASTAGIRFGTDQNNLARSQIDPTVATEHTISIPGLAGATTYYYQVQSLDNDRDYSSESAYSPTYNFATLATPSISNVAVSNITLSAAEISWETSSPSKSTIYYGTSLSYGTSWDGGDSFTTNHTYKFTSLVDSTTYHFRIVGTDQDGNVIPSDDYIFDTLPRPKISAVNFTADSTHSYISWTTNVPTTSSVNYFPSAGNASYEESQSSYITSHKVELSNLSDNQNYNFTVSGADQFGNAVQSDQYVFTTPVDKTPPVISDIIVETSNVGLNLQDKSQIIVSWKTDKLSTSQVEYAQGLSGDQYSSQSTEDKTLTNSHVVVVSGLQPSQPYHVRVTSTDKNGNVGKSGDQSIIPGAVQKSILQTILQALSLVFGWLGFMVK